MDLTNVASRLNTVRCITLESLPLRTRMIGVGLIKPANRSEEWIADLALGHYEDLVTDPYEDELENCTGGCGLPRVICECHELFPERFVKAIAS
jgi:hypothetical protein